MLLFEQWKYYFDGTVAKAIASAGTDMFTEGNTLKLPSTILMADIRSVK